MIIVFTRRIRGKEGGADSTGRQMTPRYSISIPKDISRNYGIKWGDIVKMKLQDSPINPKLVVSFPPKKISKAGLEGKIIYLNTNVVLKYGLRKGMKVFVKLITMREDI